MATLTNAKAFKGILQVKSLPATPEKGYIYLVGDGTQGGNGTGIYFGTRYYGKTENSVELINLKNSITANTKSIEDIEAILGEWKENFTGNLATVAQAVVAVSGATEANTIKIATLSGTVANNLTATTKAIADAKSELLGDAGTKYNTLGKLEDEIQKVAQSVTDKNVSAIGDTYVSASAEGNTVTVAATTALTQAVEKANSAVQTVAEGTTNGTIAVDGDNVSVHGLGSAAFTEASAYDASGAASTVKSELLGATKEGDVTTIAALNTKIEDVEDAVKSYTISAVTVSGEENVLEAYALYDEDGTQAGETIKIYKDQSLKNVELSGQTLVFTYELAAGSEKTVSVDVSAFLSESEFGNGLQVVDHKVSVKKDASSEGFLSVSENGVKVSGIQGAINAATSSKAESSVVTALNDVVTAHTSNTEIHVTTIDKEKWNKAEDNAKAYTDTKISGVNETITTISGKVDNNTTAITANLEAITAETKARVEAVSALTAVVNTKLDKATHEAYTATTQTVLAGIESRLSAITDNAVTSIASSGKTITVTETEGGAFNVEVNTLAVEAAQANGYIAIENNGGALYGVMYYGGDDAE